MAAEPSFDCAAAKAPIERLICASDALAALDGELGRAFAAGQARRDPGQRRAALDEQQKWLRQRLSDCAVPATGTATAPASALPCLIGLYRARLAALGGPALEVPAAGRHAQVISVPGAGRYALRVESDVGVGLELIDRMAGSLGSDGEAGSQDGRIDLILDRGSYKAVLTGPDDADGKAQLRVDAFRELNGANPPRLVELRPVDGDLDDLTQRSWWLDIPAQRDVFIEAAGRHLADLRLWRDGNWLAAAEPAAERLEPETGRPQQLRRIVATLEPGLYLLTAYGGPGEAWAQESDAKPFHLRFGLPLLAEAARVSQVAGPFGFDRFLVPEKASFARLSLGEAAPAALAAQLWNPGAPLPAPGSRAEIAKSSRNPYAELAFSAPAERRTLLTVAREAGKPYRLEVIPAASSYRIAGSGDHWLETLDIGGADEIDSTAVLTEQPPAQPERILAETAVKLSAEQAWRRRFNLLDPVSLFVAVPTAGEWTVQVDGEQVEAQSRFEPVGPRPSTYRAPAFAPSMHGWLLERGFYLLTLRPLAEKKGIATVTLSIAGASRPPATTPQQGPLALRALSLAANTSYRLYTGTAPGVRRGLIFRKLPIDLAQDLPLTLRAAERVEVAIEAPAAGMLELVDEGGGQRSLALDGGAAVPRAAVSAGKHRVTIVNPGDRPLALTLRLRPDTLRADQPLPALAAERLRAIPSFPTLAPGKPAYLDLARNETRTFNLAVGAPALFRLETTGLLKTQATLRTRTVTALDRDTAGGIGRNFLIARYLREGDYQLTFGTTGRSAGHLGLSLTTAPIVAAGSLAANVPSRATLRADTGLAWDFTIDRPGPYQLGVLGLGRDLYIRVEDEDGWPVAEPILKNGLEQDFDPGRYRLIVQPEASEARVIATLTEALEPVERSGHGPHAVAFGEPVEHEWLEPDGGGERLPDVWRFALPAPADTTLSLSEGMLATLVREGPGGSGEILAPAIREPGWSGRLAAGAYRIELRALRPNNHLTYTLGVDTAQLVAGQSRTLKLPISIPVSLGGNDLVEIGSAGAIDVRARLYDREGRIVAANDDRPDDWNFAITGTYPPGEYRLRVDAASPTDEEVSTQIALRRPDERPEPALSLPGNATVADADVHTWPLQVTGSGLLVAAANSADPLDLSLERAEGDGQWRTIGRSSGRSTFLAIPVAGAGPAYRLRVWSPERRGLAIALAARLVTLPAVAETRFATGVVPQPVDGLDPPLFVTALQPDGPGLLRIGKDLSWSSGPGEVARAEEIAIADSGPVWLVGRSRDAVSVRRPGADEAVKLTLPPAGISLAVKPEAGARLWVAESLSGQPGIAFADRARAPTATGIGATSAVALGNGGTLLAWNAGEPGSPLPITLRSIPFGPPAAAALPPGESDTVLPVGGARRLDLGTGAKRLRLRLPAQMAAIIANGDTALATLWSEGESREWVSELGADRVLLVNAAAGEARASIGWTALPGDPFRLTVDRPLKRYDGAGGTLRIAIAPAEGKPGMVHVHAAGAAAELVTPEGRVLRGPDLALAGPGTLSIAHGPGLIAAWLDPPASTAPPTVTIAEPVRVLPLSGAVARLAFDPQTPVLLRLRSTVPLIASVITPDGGRATQVAADGARLARYLPAGRNLVELQATTDGPLSGEVELLQSPVVPIDEGLGDKVLLSGGESRLYGFTLTRTQTIGVGVRAAVDIASCRLFDAGGKELGTGVVQMQRLPAGAYLLAVDIPPESAPVEIQPALVGARLPDSGPPMEIRQSYLRLVGRGPSE